MLTLEMLKAEISRKNRNFLDTVYNYYIPKIPVLDVEY